MEPGYRIISLTRKTDDTGLKLCEKLSSVQVYYETQTTANPTSLGGPLTSKSRWFSNQPTTLSPDNPLPRPMKHKLHPKRRISHPANTTVSKFLLTSNKTTFGIR